MNRDPGGRCCNERPTRRSKQQGSAGDAGRAGDHDGTLAASTEKELVVELGRVAGGSGRFPPLKSEPLGE